MKAGETADNPACFDVVGEGRPNDDGTSRQAELTACEPGEPVELIRQSNNAYDRNAIFVRSCRSVGIGYLSAENAAVLAPALEPLGLVRPSCMR